MKDQVIVGILSGIVVALVIWLVKTIKEKKDTNTILDFLTESQNNTEFNFRSNHVIASELIFQRSVFASCVVNLKK